MRPSGSMSLGDSWVRQKKGWPADLWHVNSENEWKFWWFQSRTMMIDHWIYSIYRYYRRYSGIISNRRCFLGVRPNAFQIEDIAECKSSSNDQKSKNKPLNIGMIFGISSIWKSFVPLPFFVFFAGKLSKINRTLTPDLGDPPKRRVPKYLPKWDPAGGTLAFSPSGGGSVKNCSKTMGFLAFLIEGWWFKPLFK